MRRDVLREDLLVLQDEALEEVVDEVLLRHLRAALAARRHQRGAHAHRQVPRVHHVLLAVLRQAAEGASSWSIHGRLVLARDSNCLRGRTATVSRVRFPGRENHLYCLHLFHS